jgi:hypothetical protein
MFNLPFDPVSALKIPGNSVAVPPFVARGTLKLEQVGDTFLDLRG